ncbi:MAG: hypothetical protein LBG83_00780 [Oscillospiraceae bacterium]|jgi:hypothetical protein|nr:hypothetical protein [Oscillospiraceae bacterium]
MNNTQQAVKAFQTSRKLARAAKFLGIAQTAAMGCAAAALLYCGAKTIARGRER